MLAHRKKVNRTREENGRGKFRWGPRVNDSSLTEIVFECQDTSSEHPSDDESDYFALEVINGVAVNRGIFQTRQREIEESIFHPSESMRDEHDSRENLNDHASFSNSEHSSAASSSLGNGLDDAESDKNHSSNHNFGSGNHSPFPSDNSSGQTEDPIGSDLFMEELSDEVEQEMLLRDGLRANRGVLEWARENKVWVQLFNKHGLELTVMDDILKNLRAPMKCWKTIISNICTQASLKSEMQTFQTCPGHMCFVEFSDAPEINRCSDCSSLKPRSHNSPTVSYIPLLPRIQAMLMDQQNCNSLFQYHQTFSSEPGIYRDFFDCASYRRICNNFRGEECVKWDIFLAASTDGFQAYKNRTVDVWPILAIMLNLPPEQRYAVTNVLPLMFIPDGRQPSNIQSFLIPLINEINSTIPDGVLLKFYDGTQRKVRLHLVWFSTDLDGLTKVASLTGHNGKTPCRFCLLQGLYCAKSRHYYYPCSILKPNNSRPSVRFNPASLPLRSVESIESAIERVNEATKKSERVEIAKETGIKGDSSLFKLSNIVPYHSFPIDIMHLFYNVQKHLLNIQTSNVDDAFCLSLKEIEVLDSELISFGDGISGQIAAMPRKFSTFQTWKAAEHKMFTLCYYMILLDGYIPDLYMAGLGLFVEMVDICFRPVLTEEDFHQLSKISVAYIKHFERNFMRYDPCRLRMSPYVMHLILHLAEGVRENGPLVNTSQYWVERYIGWIVDRLNAKRLPAASFRNSAMFSESYKMAFAIPFTGDNDDDTHQWEEGFKLLNPVGGGDVDAEVENGINIRRLLAGYLIRKFEGMTVREAEKIANGRHSCQFWGKVRFRRNGYGEIQTASVASKRSLGRPSYYVASEMDASDSSADVYYGQLLYLLEIDLAITDQELLGKFQLANGKHYVSVINWARPLSQGKQLQVYIKCRPSAAFSSPTMEDITIIKRLIGAVNHAVPPVERKRRGLGQRAQQRTYFVDSDLRQDHLLSDRKRSVDGVNRILKGMASGR